MARNRRPRHGDVLDQPPAVSEGQIVDLARASYARDQHDPRPAGVVLHPRCTQVEPDEVDR